MESNETASTTSGGPRVIVIFDVHGCCRAQINHFFGVVIGSRARQGLGLMLGSRLHRMRMRLGHPIALRALELIHWVFMLKLSGLSASVSSVGDCARLVPTLSDPGETAGPRIDRIPPTRLTTSAPRIKKLLFCPPISVPLISLDQYPTE